MNDLFEQAGKILEDIKAEKPADAGSAEQFRIKYLGSKGIVKTLFAGIKDVPAEGRKEYGLLVNEVKTAAEEKYKSAMQVELNSDADETGDVTLPAAPMPLGSRHPISIVRDRIVDIFSRIGFTVSEGPEIVDDWHNFSALNIPEHHPARDMQDTYYLKASGLLLRTHTSSVQVQVMESTPPPIRTISPGRVYRNETISARAHCQFHQVEGLYIDEGVSFADMKQTLMYFAREMFGADTEIRMRPSYFPFTEPSGEMDVTCLICHGKGCPVCKKSGWVEILGFGMVDPAVLENCKIDPEKYSGFAFGMGIERIAMLRYQITDIRLFFENDVRFLRQFAGLDRGN